MAVDYTPSFDPADVDSDYGSTGGDITVPTFTANMKPFRFWCQRALPLVYDDSLSYYEVLCKVVDQMNGFLTDLQTATGSIGEFATQFVVNQQFLNDMAAKLGQDVNTLETYINERMEDFTTAYNQLQSYVNNYFDNLDVQQEINNKLDAMASDGTFNTLFNPVITAWMTEKTAQIDSAIANQDALQAEQNARISVLESRMDGFSSLPAGSTSGNAELLDIRTNFLGETYPSAGDAVRASDMIVSGFQSIGFTRLTEWNGNSESSVYDTIVFDVAAYKGGRVTVIANMENFAQAIQDGIGIGLYGSNVAGKTEDSSAQQYPFPDGFSGTINPVFKNYSVISTGIQGEERILLQLSIPDNFAFQYLKLGNVEVIGSGTHTTPEAIVYATSWSKTPVDDTLSIAGDAADAKVTGDSISSLNERLNSLSDKINPVFIPVDISELTWQEGYISWNNGNPTAAYANGSCKVSSPLLLRKGQTIIVNCSGYTMVTSIISKVLRIGNTPQVSYYQPLIRDVGTIDHQYLYTALEDEYISITYYYGGNIPVSASIIYQIDSQYENIKTVRLDKSFLTSANVYTTNGFSTYSNWFSSDYIPLENIKELVYLRSNSFTTIYMIAFFDEDQTFISGELPDISTNFIESIFTNITIPTNAKFFRIASCIRSDMSIGILGYIEKTSTLLSQKIDLTNRILSKNLWLGTSSTSQYSGWYSTDYIDLDNVKKIMKVSTAGHTLLNSLTLFDADKNPTRGFTASANNIHYILKDIDLLPNEKYAVVSWGEFAIDGVLIKSSDIDFIVELIVPKPVSKDYSYLVSQFDNILCIGDSLTQGDYGSIPEGTANIHEKNYPHYLSRYLNTNVINQGVSGTYPVWWWNNKSRIDLTINYDCIFFFLGTNHGFTDTISEDTASGDYNTYADTETGRYCSMIEWLKANIPDAKIFLISFPHNYRDWTWYINNLSVLYKIAEKYNLPVVDMTVDVPFTRYNGDIYRPVGYNPNGNSMPEKYGNLHFGTLGYQTFAEYLIRNTGKVMSENLIEYKGKLD